MNRKPSTSALAANLQELLASVVQPTTMKFELITDEGQIETIHLESTWPGMSRFLRDPEVRRTLQSLFARQRFDLVVKNVTTVESDVEVETVDVAEQLPIPGTTAQVYQMFGQRDSTPAALYSAIQPAGHSN